ncbi:recombinase family protein [Chryseobacterium limigenitum]|uniref:Site-specific DNA recombinase n=1 Tax=Chryseobacterium limigenitum TaxID=1612149 RepID=A0A1K2ISQ5_9FLAO|nr:recombinase family protein [Chryseobacterium limigenitum]SFZ95224.1 Site-specific DNA recombinase [Chryseobacterium limigenitum]
MENVIIYTRVSTAEQKNHGYSLRHQKEQLENYCMQKGLRIIAHYEEDHSAKNFSARPEFQKMLRFIQSNKNKVDALLFTKWDRFSRNTEASYSMIRKLREIDIEVNSIDQPLDLTQPDSKVLLAIYLTIPEVENLKISLRVKDGVRKANKEGAYTTTAPKGYLNTRNSEGKATLMPDPVTAPIVEAIFRDYGTGLYSAEEVREKYSKKLKISRNGFFCLLKNPAYMGKILIKATKKEDEMLVEGLHPALVDSETFERVQLILKGKYKPKFRTITEIDEALPLRGFLICPKCGKTLTGSGSKGRGGRNTFYYYHCTRYCGAREKARNVNALFEQLLSEMRIEEDQETVYKSILAEKFSEQYEDKQTTINSLHRERDNLQKRIEMAEDSFFERQIDAPTFNSMKQRIDNRLMEIKSVLKALQVKERYFDKHLREGVSFLQGIDTIYREGSAEIKKKIVQALFCEKLVYHENYFSTPVIEDTIEMILFRERRLRLLRIMDIQQVEEELIVH